MIEWIVKRFVLGKLNGLLDEYRDQTAKAQETLKSWLKRLQMINSALQKLLGRLEDGSLSAQEAEDTIEDIKTVINEWK